MHRVYRNGKLVGLAFDEGGESPGTGKFNRIMSFLADKLSEADLRAFAEKYAEVYGASSVDDEDLDDQPEPLKGLAGDRALRRARVGRTAARDKSFAERYPDAARIGIV